MSKIKGDKSVDPIVPSNMLSVHESIKCHHGRFTPFSNAKATDAEKTSNRFIASGIAVSTNHMCPYKHDDVC